MMQQSLHVYAIVRSRMIEYIVKASFWSWVRKWWKFSILYLILRRALREKVQQSIWDKATSCIVGKFQESLQTDGVN